MAPPRMTPTTTAVLRLFVDEPGAERYGLEIMDGTGLPSGTVFPILARFEGLGWLTSGWEDVDPRVARRPARRYYRLTGTGLESARAALQGAAAERVRRVAPARAGQQWAGGLA